MTRVASAIAVIGCAATTGCAASIERRSPETSPAEIEIIRFEPPAGVLGVGDTAVSSIVIRNASTEPRRLWIGYSVGAPTGEWFDVQSHPITLDGSGVSGTEAKRWAVPLDAPAGRYRAVIGIWSAPPEDGGDAVRLAVADSADAFEVLPVDAGFYAATHELGRGRFRDENVIAAAPGFTLTLPASGCDGAEIRTRERYVDGTFIARMKTPFAPGSLSAFFLYEDVPGGNDELDIEIPNDGSRTLLLTAWRDGLITHQEELELPFDPAAGFHEYQIRRLPGRVEMRVDGVTLAAWRRDTPRQPMRVVANVWWPTWLECTPPGSDVALEIERIEIETTDGKLVR